MKTADQAKEILQECARSQFDPMVINAFMRIPSDELDELVAIDHATGEFSLDWYEPLREAHVNPILQSLKEQPLPSFAELYRDLNMELPQKPKDVWDALRNVQDPELGIDVVSLGLVRDVERLATGTVRITMTLVSPECPMGEAIEVQIQKIVGQLHDVSSVEVKWDLETQWSTDSITSEMTRRELCLIDEGQYYENLPDLAWWESQWWDRPRFQLR